jgi:hypothetical protein
MPITTAPIAIRRGLPSFPANRSPNSSNVAGRYTKLAMATSTAETAAAE